MYIYGCDTHHITKNDNLTIIVEAKLHIQHLSEFALYLFHFCLRLQHNDFSMDTITTVLFDLFDFVFFSKFYICSQQILTYFKEPQFHII